MTRVEFGEVMAELRHVIDADQVANVDFYKRERRLLDMFWSDTAGKRKSATCSCWTLLIALAAVRNIKNRKLLAKKDPDS